MSDVIGLTMVVDYNTSEKPEGAFESSVLGPFYRENAPWIELDGSICRQADSGVAVRVSGRILSVDGKPIPGGVLDIWQVASNGKYENTDPTQPDFNLRGRLRAAQDAERYGYPIPFYTLEYDFVLVEGKTQSEVKFSAARS
jgi:catechol 1,2-dioxygenase